MDRGRMKNDTHGRNAPSRADLAGPEALRHSDQNRLATHRKRQRREQERSAYMSGVGQYVTHLQHLKRSRAGATSAAKPNQITSRSTQDASRVGGIRKKRGRVEDTEVREPEETCMTSNATTWVIENSPLEQPFFTVHCVIANTVDWTHDYCIHVGDEELAKMSRRSVRTVRRAKTKMIALGLLEVVDDSYSHGRFKTYRLLTPEILPTRITIKNVRSATSETKRIGRQ